MSSTNRGAERSADDFYASPAWAVDTLIRRLPPLAGKRILEPSAGTGAIVRRLLAAGATSIDAVEIDRKRALQVPLGARLHQGDFASFVLAPGAVGFDMAIMNPPFSFAEPHIRRAIGLLAPGGLCCALERLSFACSKRRSAFRAAHPFDLFILAQRPGFATEERIGGSTAPQQALFDEEPVEAPEPGQTDSADYAWFAFGTRPDGTPCGGRFEMIEEGPSA